MLFTIKGEFPIIQLLGLSTSSGLDNLCNLFVFRPGLFFLHILYILRKCGAMNKHASLCGQRGLSMYVYLWKDAHVRVLVQLTICRLVSPAEPSSLSRGLLCILLASPLKSTQTAPKPAIWLHAVKTNNNIFLFDN